MEGHPNPIPVDVLSRWDDVLADMEEVAAEYRDRGWETFVLNPGHVVVLPRDASRMGFDVLVPDNEFDPVNERVEDGSVEYDEFRVFREEADGITYCLVVAEDPEAESVVQVPVYYDPHDSSFLLDQIWEKGYVHVHVHPLSTDKGIVTFELDDPELFLPG